MSINNCAFAYNIQVQTRCVPKVVALGAEAPPPPRNLKKNIPSYFTVYHVYTGFHNFKFCKLSLCLAN